jgi:hypothetical protein
MVSRDVVVGLAAAKHPYVPLWSDVEVILHQLPPYLGTAYPKVVRIAIDELVEVVLPSIHERRLLVALEPTRSPSAAVDPLILQQRLVDAVLDYA